ncbi:MAG: HAD family hydrolase [Clostridia bacterium]|nr:HAD family hydrolase [Clostridia bacterium]
MGVKAVLFDLDGTLLKNDRNRMGDEYIKLVYNRFPDTISPEKFEKAMYAAFMAMTKNDGRKINKQVFIETFFPLIDYPADEGMQIFDYVHKHDLPSLEREEEKVPEAKRVVEKVFDLGYQVVIATNPIFPKDVMFERLKWAGVDKFPFKLVTSFENCKFAKPNPQYYKQITDRIDIKPEQCLMIGDEHMDMVAAHVGIRTFFVKSPSSDLRDSTPKPTYRGKLEDIINILEK